MTHRFVAWMCALWMALAPLVPSAAWAQRPGQDSERQRGVTERAAAPAKGTSKARKRLRVLRVHRGKGKALAVQEFIVEPDASVSEVVAAVANEAPLTPLPHHLDPVAQQQARPRTATAVTEERPIFEHGYPVGPLQIGLTISEINLVRDPLHRGMEVVHVVGPSGETNVELVLRRWPLGKKGVRRLEWQGPALNANTSAPLDMRVMGIGITQDIADPLNHEGLSYTFEAKATVRTLAAALTLALPAVKWLVPENSAAMQHVADVMIGAVPWIGAVLAVTSMARAWHVVKTPNTFERRAFAVAHAAFDSLRVFMPWVGALANGALVAVSAVRAYLKAKALLRDAAEAEAAAPSETPAPPVATSAPKARAAEGRRAVARSLRWLDGLAVPAFA